MGNHLVQLDQYTLSTAVNNRGHRFWCIPGGPHIVTPPGNDSHCRVLEDEHKVSRTEVERRLIADGWINPEIDDPMVPISPWTRVSTVTT